MNLLHWVTKENITLVVAALGLALSTYQIVVSRMEQHQKLDMEILSCIFTDCALTFYLSFINFSQLPVAITRITLLHGDAEIDCFPEKTWVKTITEQTGSKITRQDVVYSTPLPISVSSLGAAGGYVLFRVPQGMLPERPTELTFQFCTNRGRKLKKTLAVPPKDTL